MRASGMSMSPVWPMRLGSAWEGEIVNIVNDVSIVNVVKAVNAVNLVNIVNAVNVARWRERFDNA
jgi:hypothetical protein